MRLPRRDEGGEMTDPITTAQARELTDRPSDATAYEVSLFQAINSLADQLDAARVLCEKAQAERNSIGVEIRREWMAKCDAVAKERDAARESLVKANAQAEHFERNWYLRGDELDALRAQVAAVEKERDAARAELEAWKETAAQHSRNEDFYRGLIQGIGSNFGAPAYTSDDGSVQQDVLALRVPELVNALREQVRQGAALLRKALPYVYVTDPEARSESSLIEDYPGGIDADVVALRSGIAAALAMTPAQPTPAVPKVAISFPPGLTPVNAWEREIAALPPTPADAAKEAPAMDDVS